MSILITGAANGLGAALSNEAQGRGETVVGIDYDWKADATVAARHVLQIDADLSDLEALSPLCAHLAAHAPFKAVFHNAAISATGRFEAIPAATHQRLIDINLSAPLILTRNLLAKNALQKGGTLVFIASLSVQVGYPGAASYAASKAALANYAKSLRKALRPDDIRVLVVYPGPMKTDQASRHAPKGADEEKRMDAEEVAKQIWNAIDKRKREVVPGTTNRLFAVAGRLAPRLLDQAMRKIIYDKLDGPVY